MSQIITLDDLTSYMPGTTLDDALAQQIVDGLNSYVENQIHRCFGETKQVVGERYTWSNAIWLRQSDIISIDAMSLGWPGQSTSQIQSSGYYFNPLGRVTLYTYANGNGSRLYNDYLSISYTYGQTTVPDDLKLAALAIAGGAYTWAINGNRNVAGVSIGSYRIQYAQKRGATTSSPHDEAAVSGDIAWTIIDSYRIRRQ